MSLKFSAEYKELFEKIYKDDMNIEYIISYNSGFIKFKINTNISNLPTKIDELFKYNPNLKNIYEANKINILITLNNNLVNKQYFKIQFIEEIN
jgi:hypothetical protein